MTSLPIAPKLRATTILMLCASMRVHAAAAEAPEQRAIEAIRTTAVAALQGSTDHPLPLVSGWMDGRQQMGFGPAYQIQQIQRGQYLMPWFAISDDSFQPAAADPYPTPGDALYFEPAVQYLAEHHLPLTLVSEEWEVLMSRVSPEYARAGGDVKQVPLSPFGAVESWYALGREWAHHKTLRRLEKLYPDPPLVLIMQDDEYPRLSDNDLQAHYEANGDFARRRAISDAWIARYRAMLRGFREGLESPAWRARLVIASYDQFVTSAVGRWSGWTDYSLYVPGRTEPWPLAWDGASVPFYQHNYFPDSDFIVWSPQIEAMNFVPEVQAVRRLKPAYWLEMSTWDGQEPGTPSDKLAFYAARGQQYTPIRYGGMVQFGMWLLRPCVVREFRNPEHDRIRFGPYFDALLAAAARVHENETLRAFWSEGKLLENPVGGHPYQENLPAELAARPRWYLLDTPLNPPRPWKLDTPLRIFALALERGRKPNREWLVYAFSPLDAAVDAQVTIPGGPLARVRATVGGAFTLVREGESTGHPVD